MLQHDNFSSNYQLINEKFLPKPHMSCVFAEVIDEVRDLHDNAGGGEVGMLVCGPETLTCTVAELCRSMNFSQFWRRSTTQFHYHAVSFDL